MLRIKKCRRCKVEIRKHNRVLGKPICRRCQRSDDVAKTERRKDRVLAAFQAKRPDVVFIGESKSYMVSPLGEVFRWGNTKVTQLNPHQDDNGYLIVDIKVEPAKKSKMWRVHRLVAFAFIPNPYPYRYPHINHINAIKTDNRVENLEWCNIQQNIRHAKKMGLIKRGEDVKASKLTEAQVKEIWLLKGTTTYKAIAEKYGVHWETIKLIHTEKIWKHVEKPRRPRRRLITRNRYDNEEEIEGNNQRVAQSDNS